MTWNRSHIRLAAMVIALALVAACSLLRSEQPKITLQQQAEWLQARAELAEAKNAVTQLEAKLNGIVQAMQATCPLVLKDGRPECAPPAKAEPKKK